MDVSQYLEIFLDETKEHLQSLSDQLMSLEQDPENMDTINEIFRAAHTLKGMAGTMGYKRMQNLTHDMENVFSEVRSGAFKADGSMIDILFQCLDALEEYTDNIQNTSDEGDNDNDHLIKALNDILKTKGGSVAAPAKEERKAESAASDETDSAKEKWREIPIQDTEQTVLSEAVKMGKKVMGITVYVQESCILKAARAFLVYKALEDLGETIVSVPSAQDIEDEKFDFDFSVIFITDSDCDTVRDAVMSVSEIENCYLSLMEVEAPQEEEKKEVEEKEKKPAVPAAAASSTTAPPAKSDKNKNNNLLFHGGFSQVLLWRSLGQQQPGPIGTHGGGGERQVTPGIEYDTETQNFSC